MAWARLKQLKDADGRPLYPTRLEVPNDVWTATVDEIEAKEKMKEEGRKVAEMGGLHIVGTERHESPPHRQPAPRPRRPAGRPRLAAGSTCRCKTT